MIINHEGAELSKTRRRSVVSRLGYQSILTCLLSQLSRLVRVEQITLLQLVNYSLRIKLVRPPLLNDPATGGIQELHDVHQRVLNPNQFFSLWTPIINHGLDSCLEVRKTERRIFVI